MKRTTLFTIFLTLLSTQCHLYAQDDFEDRIKFSGNSPDGLQQAFVNQDKTWYQDAKQAYHGNDLIGADGALSKLDWSLVYTLYQWTNHTTINPGVSYEHEDELYPYVEGKHLIEIACSADETWMQLEPALIGLGATGISHAGLQMNAWLPIANTDEAAQLDGVEFIRPAYRTTRSGLTTSQGDLALSADLGRAISPGFSGKGITIGTLSDSFATATATATTAEQDETNDDLPTGIEVLQDANQAESDEGRAMMQIIHDLAPGSEQQFFTAFNGQANFANGIRALADAGCDIIVDDVFYFSEPFFQNGLVAQAVNDVTEQGVAYFSAAGNSGRQSYESPFQPSTEILGLSGGPLHDFDSSEGTDTFMELTIPEGSSVTFAMQWDQPFASVSGAPGCQSDIDILLTGSGNGQFRVLGSSFASNVGGDPVEIFTFANDGTIDIDGVPGADTTFNLVLEGVAGPLPGILKIIFFDRGSFAINEFDTQSGTLVGHANAEKAIAVAAAAFFQTPAFGANPPQLESFSSPGGNFLLFTDDGVRLEQALDTKQPRITATDGGNTTFFGQQLNDGDTFPNFFGTSAAAPHAAAVAALLLEKAGGPGSLSPSDIDATLRETAIDMNAPGIDEDSGAGLIDALAALNFIISPVDLTSDNDGDGVALLLELAIGTDPDVADFKNPARPAISQNADGKIAFTFGRGSEPLAGTVLIVERSTTLLEDSFEEVYRFEFDDESSTLGSGIVEELLENQFLITDELQAEGRAFYRLSASF
ncbi:S8 family peptidase [Rubritalea sp.]|uniref:S8 family peptidase n=1 Tax=Rubritalea sp. TaxID=2109375 RepID=UPI003EF99334